MRLGERQVRTDSSVTLQRRDLVAAPSARNDEKRRHELAWIDSRLADEGAQGRVRAEPARALGARQPHIPRAKYLTHSCEPPVEGRGPLRWKDPPRPAYRLL